MDFEWLLHFRGHDDFAADSDAGTGEVMGGIGEVGEFVLIDNLDALKARAVVDLNESDGFGGTIGSHPAFNEYRVLFG